MHYLLFIGAILFFAFMVPLKVTFATCILLLFITTTVKISTKVVANVTPTFGETFKAVGLAFLFIVIALFTLISFMKGTGVPQIDGMPGLVVLAAFFSAYTLGFKVGLGTTFGASAVIALISTGISFLFILGTKGLI